MISQESLFFSYGLKNHGKLVIGFRTNFKDATRGFRTTPTLITPLLENGGKAIHCAAGVDHSLVVVAMPPSWHLEFRAQRASTTNSWSCDHWNASDELYK
jgi:hypothetical protein